MESFIKQTSGGLKNYHGYELIDRTDRHVIARGINTFDLEAIAEVYCRRLGRPTDIQSLSGSEII
ncbi:MAG: hypothetical protein AAB649_00290 [Patescibacteria group bacterium]